MILECAQGKSVLYFSHIPINHILTVLYHILVEGMMEIVSLRASFDLWCTK